MGIQIKPFTLESIIDEAPGVRTFRFIPKNIPMPKFIPGQWFSLFLPDEKGNMTISRPYSIASSTEKPYIEFGIKLAGSFTHKLFELKEGADVGFAGPFGAFTFKQDLHKEVVLLAGGIGIAPFRAFMQTIADKKLQNRATLFYSNKTFADIAYYNEFNELVKNNPTLKVVYTITREKPDGWQFELGRFDQRMLEKYVQNPNEKQYFICGSSSFADTFYKMITEEWKIPKEQVKKEGFG